MSCTMSEYYTHFSINEVVDVTKWLQTPSGEVTTVDGNSIDEIGLLPLPNIAGIACE